MRILHVNKFGTATSGAEGYFLQLARRQVDAGHTVGAVCMRPVDVPASVAVFEVGDIDFHELPGAISRLQAAHNVWWSRRAAAVMQRSLTNFRPDVVHFHNYAHQLSSSVVEVANDAGVPTFHTAHDYKLICPAYVAYRDGSQCFRCAAGRTIHCVSGRCLHGSLTWSGLAAAEALAVRRRPVLRVPRALIAPSQFMADRLRGSWLAGAAGISIKMLRNPIDTSDDVRPRKPGNAGLYVGRLSPEKGLDLLITAAAQAELPITIVGDGPERRSLEALASRLDAPVTFTGHLTGAELERQWATARYLALTPRWPENAPLVMLEAMARQIPVAVTNVGGAAEVVRQYGGGIVIERADVGEISQTLTHLSRFGAVPVNLHSLFTDLGWPRHLDSLLSLYESAARKP